MQRAAQMMDELNVGVDSRAGRPQAGGHDHRPRHHRPLDRRRPGAGQGRRVGDVMSTDVRTCAPEQTVDEVLGQHGDAQIRRVPVVDAASHEVVDIVSAVYMATISAAGIDHNAGGDFDAGRAGPFDDGLADAALKRLLAHAAGAPPRGVDAVTRRPAGCDGCAATEGRDLHAGRVDARGCSDRPRCRRPRAAH